MSLIAKANSLQLMAVLVMVAVQYLFECFVEFTNGLFNLYDVPSQLARGVRLPVPVFIPILRFIYQSIQLASPRSVFIFAY